MKKILSLLLVLALTLSLAGCSLIDDLVTVPNPGDDTSSLPSVSQSQPTEDIEATQPSQKTEPTDPELWLDPNGAYNSKEDVALYIHLYGRLPRNYYTKSEAKANGWSTSGVDRYEEFAAIGGDVFQNREGLLPRKEGRTWTECDIGTWGRTQRGAQRIVFSNDGLVYYTSNHYASFELLYGDPDA